MKKKNLVTIIVLLAVITLVIFILTRSTPEVNEELAKCIGENSLIYVQLGCHACETQEKIFGKSYNYLTTIDCFFEKEVCIEKGIRGTPTWIINEKEYLGVRAIDELKELTGC